MHPDTTLTTAKATDARPITALALANHIDWSEFVPSDTWRETRRFAYGRSYAVGDDATLFLFGFGATVYDGPEAMPEALRTQIEQCTGRRSLPDTAETYRVAVDPAAASDAPRIGWDRVVIPERRSELIAAIALLLGQSAALERYELAADALLDQALVLAGDLAQHQRFPHSTTALIQRVGRLTMDRLEITRWFFFVDRPEDTWEDARVAQLYDALFSNLELRQRHDSVLHKLGAVERATQSTLEMWHGRRSNALEWAIVVLIVIDIVFGFLGLL